MKRLETIKAANMRIGDVVKLNTQTGVYSHSTVIDITERKTVKLFRPYVHLADFIYTGGVIPYLGNETWEVQTDSSTEFILIDNIFRGSEWELKSPDAKRRDEKLT